MRLQMRNVFPVANWRPPERRSDGVASTKTKETSSLPQNHLFETEIVSVGCLYFCGVSVFLLDLEAI